MAEITSISWADATLNFWIGCTKVSPACDHCYAEQWGKRFGVKWGVGELRRLTVGWIRKVRALERRALAKLAAGEGAFFCFSNSLSDFFDKEVPAEVRRAAFDAMREAPHVTFLLLTKRPGLIYRLTKEAADAAPGWKGFPDNAAIGCTIIDQDEADRELPRLKMAMKLVIPAFSFVSMEPLLAGVDLTEHLRQGFLGWVITGGESGAHARPSNPAWFRALRDQCEAAGVPFHFKQWGEWQPYMAQVPTNANLPPHWFEPGGVPVWRIGKDHDPCTLDGVSHLARPPVAI